MALATLIPDNNFGDPNSTMSRLINLTSYICGEQISNTEEDGIFQLVYKANCYDSVLGAEAAIKSSEYVNKVSSYLEAAYKALFTISMAKLYVCENRDQILAELEAGTVAPTDLSGYTKYTRTNIVNAVFAENKTSLRAYYNKLFDDSQSDSVFTVYNRMIEENWFNYIDSTDYSQQKAVINFITLHPHINLCPVENLGYEFKEIDRAMGFVSMLSTQMDVSNACDYASEITMATLNTEQIDRLMQHLANNPVYGTDRKDLTYQEALERIGFNFSEYTGCKSNLNTSTGYMPAEYNYKNYGSVADHYWLSQGYDLQDKANNGKRSADLTVASSIDYKPFAYNKDAILVYFSDEPFSLSIGSVIGSVTPLSFVIIGVGFAAIIAVPTVIIVRNKKKQKAVTAAEEDA